MKIKTIESLNVKGRSFTLNIDPVTVLIGDSFSGKTAVLDCVRLALLGYHPKLGKRAADTMKLCHGDRLQAALAFDNGQRLERTWLRVKDSVTTPGKIPDALVPPALLDCREYFSMTGAARMKYVFDQIDLGKEFTVKKVLSKVRTVTPEASGEATETALAEAVEIVNNLHEARVMEDASIQEWVQGILLAFAERKKSADAVAKSFVGLSAGATQLKAAAAEAPAQSCEGPLKIARELVQTISNDIHQQRTALAAREKHTGRIATLRTALAGETDVSAMAARLREKIAGLEERLRQPAPPVHAVSKKMTEAQIRLRTAEAALDSVEKAFELLKDTNAKNLALPSCPFCGADEPGWKDKVRAQFTDAACAYSDDKKERTANIKTLREAFDALAKEFQEAQTKESVRETLQRDLTLRRRELDELAAQERTVANWRTELSTLEATAPPAADAEKVAKLEAELALAKAHVTTLDEGQRRFIAAKAGEAQLLKAKAAHALQAARVEVFKLAIEAVKALQQEMIDRAIGGLMKVANCFTDGILTQPLEYRDGDIGYWNAGGWVTHECFSGTEEALAYAGLSVALAQQSKFKLVMIDELGIVDGACKGKIIDRMIELVKTGVIDQFIGADVSGEDVALDGVTLIPITK